MTIELMILARPLNLHRLHLVITFVFGVNFTY